MHGRTLGATMLRIVGDRSTRCSFRRPLLVAIAAQSLLLSSAADATTLTLDFDEPDFAAGQSIQTIGPVTFVGGATVFRPTNVATFSGTQALRRPISCPDTACANGAYRMVIRFGTPLPFTNGGLLPSRADSVSMYVGADSISRACFPEGTTCPVYARLVGYDQNGGIVADTRDVLLMDISSISANGSFTTPITREMKITDPAAQIVAVALVYGRGTFSHDQTSFLGEPQIDHVVVNFPDNPPNTVQGPEAPSVSITRPANGTTVGSPYNLRLSGLVTVAGGLAEFCYRVNAPAPTQGADCNNNTDLKPDNTFDIPIDDALLKGGTNTVSAVVFDLSGQHATKTVSFGTNPPPLPMVSIVQPTDAQWLSPIGSINVSGTVFTVGALAGFCVLANNASTPTLQTCQQNLSAAPYFGSQPLSFSVPLSPNLFHAGA